MRIALIPLSNSPRRVAMLLCWRVIWAVIFLAHLRISARLFGTLWSQSGADADWSRLFLLSISNLYFIAEVLFAISFRYIGNRRAIVVFLLVIALLHAGPVSQCLPDVITVRDAAVWLGLTSVLVVACLRNCNWLGTVWRWFAARLARFAPPRFSSGVVPIPLAPRFPSACLRAIAQRGPPLSA